MYVGILFLFYKFTSYFRKQQGYIYKNSPQPQYSAYYQPLILSLDVALLL